MRSLSRNITRLLLITFLLLPIEGFAESSAVVPSKTEDDTWKIFARDKLERQADQLIEAGEYDQAIKILKEAMKPELQASGYHDAMPWAQLRHVYYLQGKYEEALAVLEPLLKVNFTHEPYLREKKELEAIIQAKKTGSNQPIYDFLKYMEEKYQNDLPPKGSTIKTDNIIPVFIRLYDLMGDYDGGVRFVDRILEYLYHKHRGYRDLKIIENSEQALPYIEWRDRKGLHHPDWLAYRRLREFYLIREGYLEDKKHGSKGRATKALIQSDYFPW